MKYVGVGLEDLLDIYILFIRIVTEYCAVAFHSSLTVQHSEKLENIQKTCLKLILGDKTTQLLLKFLGYKLSRKRGEKDALTFPSNE